MRPMFVPTKLIHIRLPDSAEEKLHSSTACHHPSTTLRFFSAIGIFAVSNEQG